MLHCIPLLGAAFGAKSISKGRTELIILTPRVIYDTNQIQDTNGRDQGYLKRIRKIMDGEKRR